MVALKTAQVEAFVAKPDPKYPVVLVYGPDAGLVRERAAAILATSVENANDPFAFTRLEGDELASDPMRLVDEASTIPLFGGKRAISVRAGPRNFIAAVEALLAIPIRDCRIVIEAGDLRRTAPVRVACEKAANAAVIACYADDERALSRLIDQELAAADLTITPEARAALLPLIGGDRSASSSEIRKLALYARGQGTVDVADIAAVVADASALALDDLIDAAFAGRIADVEMLFAKARAAGTSGAAIAAAALRQVTPLHKAALNVDAGASVESARERMMPPVHFGRRAAVEAALKAWSATRLQRAMTQLGAAVFDTRRQPALAAAITQRTLISIASAARRKS